jgi:hypothetical protein
MAKLVFGLNQSLDGYVDHQGFLPDPTLFRHFIEQVRGAAGSVYGRRMYEVMRYWDEDHSDWGAEERDCAPSCLDSSPAPSRSTSQVLSVLDIRRWLDERSSGPARRRINRRRAATSW